VRTEQINTTLKTAAALQWKISVPLFKNFQLYSENKKNQHHS